MNTTLLKAKVSLSQDVKDKDLWAVNLIEGNEVSEELKNGWWWATWREFVVLYFQLRESPSRVDELVREVESLLESASDTQGTSKILIEAKENGA